MSKKEKAQEVRKTQDYVKGLTKDFDKRLSEAKAQVDQVQKKAAETISELPVLAACVAFVAGIALGVALSKARE